MSLIADVREIVKGFVGQIRAQEQRMQEHEKERENWSDTRFREVKEQLEADMRDIQFACEKAVKERVEQYKTEVFKADTLDGSKLTDDATLLSGEFLLSASDLDAMLDRSAGNRTMEKLIHNYAAERNMGLSRSFFTAEQKATAAAEFMTAYARNVCARPEYYDDIWSTDEYFEEATPEALRNE